MGGEVAPRLIDIVGHFGTTYSYATVGSRVARGLARVGLLGSVSNLDAAWHRSYADLEARKGEEKSTNVFVLSVATHPLKAYPELYGRQRSAIFMSPNTRTLGREHADTCAAFGLALCPSVYCAETVADALAGTRGAVTRVAALQLGADPALLRTREERVRRIEAFEGPARALHFSTDQWWPGRKGTEELLRAWAVGRPTAHLTLHVQPSLEVDAQYLVRDLGLLSDVTVISAQARGDEDAVRALFDHADLIVQPSRCEGFGIMLLSALVAGVPLVAPYATGQIDFLDDFEGWLPVPMSTAPTPLPGEEGMSPEVETDAFGYLLGTVLSGNDWKRAMLPRVREDAGAAHGWSWDASVETWVRDLTTWLEESNE